MKKVEDMAKVTSAIHMLNMRGPVPNTALPQFLQNQNFYVASQTSALKRSNQGGFFMADGDFITPTPFH